MAGGGLDDRADAVALEVGRITLVWAQIDTILDFCNATLHDEMGKLPKDKPPAWRLAKRLEYFRAALDRVPLSSQDKERGFEIAAEISRLSDDRHWIIHGAADVQGQTGDLIRFVRTRLRDGPVVDERHWSLADIQELTRASTAAAIKLSWFLAYGLLKLTGDEFDQLRREVRNIG